MRSSRMPAQAASTTARTAARTSSSASEAVRIVVRSVATSGGVGAANGDDLEPAQRLVPSASASGTPVTPAITVVGTRARPAPRRAEPLGEVDDQRAECPRSRAGALGRGLEQVLLVGPARCEASEHGSAATSLARLDVRATASSGGERSRSSRQARTGADSVAGCSATGPNRPGSAASSARIAAASTGVDTGRRPAAASTGAARSSARR